MGSKAAEQAGAFRLPPSITSSELLSAVRYELARELEWREQTAVKVLVTKKAPDENDIPERSAETRDVLAAWCGRREATESDVRELAKFLQTFRPVTVHLTLAALPSAAQRERLVSWFRRTCRPDLLVSFAADRTIGGGIIVRTPNHVFDLSFRERLSEGRGAIARAVRNVG